MACILESLKERAGGEAQAGQSLKAEKEEDGAS